MEARLAGAAPPPDRFADGLGEVEEADFRALVAEFEASRELLGRHLLRAEEGSALLPGARFGQHRLVARLGAGGSGVVWEAEDGALGRRVALKLLHPISAVDDAARKHFAHEARVLARLTHPGIAPLLGHGETNGLDWIATELAPGGRTLAGRLQEQRRDDRAHDLRETAQRLAVLADALAHCHERGILHGDPKPSNVVIAADGSWKWVDFGLARRLDPQASAQGWSVSGWRGTPAFAAPECCGPDPAPPDPCSEVFSFGALAFEAVCGVPAFPGTSAGTFAPGRGADRPALRQLLPETPAELAWIIEKALEPERRHRYATMAELAADLRRFLAGEATLAGPPSVFRRTASWVRRRPWRAAALAAGLGAITLTSALAVRATTLRDRTVDLALAATHFVDMLDPDRALELRRTGFEPLLRIGERALTFEGFDEERAEILFAAGRALRWSEDFERALPFLEQAMELRRELHGHHSAPALEAELQYAWALARAASDPTLALPILEEVIATAPREEPALRALALNRLGQARIEILHGWDRWLGSGPSLAHAPARDDMLEPFSRCDQLIEEFGIEDPGLLALQDLDMALALVHLSHHRQGGVSPEVAQRLERAEQQLLEHFGPIHPELAYVQVARADAEGAGGAPAAEVQALLYRGIQTARRIFGPDNAQVLLWEGDFFGQARNHPPRSLLDQLPSPGDDSPR